MNRKILVYAGMFFAMLVWSMSYIVIKLVYAEGMDPATLVFIRLILAAASLQIYLRIVGKIQKIRKEDLKWFLILAIFEPFFYYIGESNGLDHVSPTLGAIIIATIPIFTPFVMSVFYKEKLVRGNLLGIILSFIGVLLVVLNDQYQLDASIKGVLFMFFAVMSALGYTVIIKRLVVKYNSYTIVAYQTLLGAFLYLPLWYFTDRSNIFEVNFNPELILYIVALALLSTTVAYILFSTGIRELGAVKSNIFANLIPVFTAVMAVLAGIEELPLKKLAGVLIVIAGVYLAQSRKPFMWLPELLSSYFRKPEK
ncbi:MAG: DMT family transporter [Bacteroidales bacterium]|nr:DMT family transporter [Bacteroidales bacterium]